jgi:hypothetical protein
MKRLPQKLALLLCFATASVLAAAPASAGWFGPKLAGVWEIVGTPDASACGPTDPFTNVVTFGLDGIVTNIDPNVGTGVGAGYKAGKKKYVVGFFGHIPIPQGVLNYEVQGTMYLLNHGTFKGKFRTIVTDPNGVVPDCIYEGKIAGTRLVPMPY